MVIKMSKINQFLWKLAEKSHSLACNISGDFCTTKTVLSIMKSAMPEQNFEQMIIYIALFKQKLWYLRHFQFFDIFINWLE
jgi:hypothetical protein